MSSPKPISATKDTVTARMARWAAALDYRHLSQDAVFQAKRFLFDSVGCALGGYQQQDVKIALDVLEEIAGRGRSTVIGTERHLLEAGPVASVRHFPRRAGLLRAREE